jgi:hypothetical protein
MTTSTTLSMAQGLRNSLRNGFCSARPLTPYVRRWWWGARIRPRPPYVGNEGEGKRGRIQSPQEVVVRDQRTGEVVQGRRRNNRELRAKAGSETATAERPDEKRGGRGPENGRKPTSGESGSVATSER